MKCNHYVYYNYTTTRVVKYYVVVLAMKSLASVATGFWANASKTIHSQILSTPPKKLYVRNNNIIIVAHRGFQRNNPELLSRFNNHNL